MGRSGPPVLSWAIATVQWNATNSNGTVRSLIRRLRDFLRENEHTLERDCAPLLYLTTLKSNSRHPKREPFTPSGPGGNSHPIRALCPATTKPCGFPDPFPASPHPLTFTS